MSIQWWEKPESRRSQSHTPGITLVYGLSGESNPANARVTAQGLLPLQVATTMGIMQRGNVTLGPVGWNLWHVEAFYGPPSLSPSGGPNLQPGQWTWNFNTSGGSRHIENVGQVVNGAIVSSYKSPTSSAAAVPDSNGTIGWNFAEKRIEGVDIRAKSLQFQVQFMHPQGQVTPAFAKHLRNCTACVNDDPFMGFDPGEVLLLGAQGSDGSSADAVVSYHFDASENVSDLTVGDIVGIVKKGHDYLWVVYKAGKNQDRPVIIPEFVYVARVYERIPFKTRLGFG
jgi:hypothetical protein